MTVLVFLLLLYWTMLVIAHRLNAIAHADRIAVTDGGRVGETGTHQELLKAEGCYPT